MQKEMSMTDKTGYNTGSKIWEVVGWLGWLARATADNGIEAAQSR
jgi:hypothetical protein